MMAQANENVAPFKRPVEYMRHVRDSLANLVSGLGGEKDKATSNYFYVTEMTQEQLTAMFRGDWVSRKCVLIPADDSTRQWRSWQAEDEQIKKIEAAERRLGLRHKVRKAMIKGRLYGGGALIMGTADTADTTQPLEIERIGIDGLQFVHAVSRHELNAVDVITDLASPWYGEPKYYERHTVDGNPLRLHPSRVIRFIGTELPDEQRQQSQQGWGDSVLQGVQDAIQNQAMVSQAIAAMVHEAKFDVIKIPDLAQTLSTKAGVTLLTERFQYANVAKSIINSILLDKDEDWERVQSNFAQLDSIGELYLIIASGAVDIPVTRMLGQSPRGLNSTGESDIRNYYDRIKSDQENTLTPAIERLDEVLIRSALGARPEEIFYSWNSLWQMTSEQKAELAAKKATTFQIDVNSGLFPDDILREARKNQLIEDEVYPGMELIDETDDDDIGQGEEETGNTMVNALHSLVKSVTSEEMPVEAAKAIAVASYPDMDEADIDAIFDPLEDFEPTPDPLEEQMRAEQLRGMQATRREIETGARTSARGAFGRAQQQQQARTNGSRERLRGRVRDASIILTDATPKPLYVRRDVLNAAEIVKWAKEAGFETTVPATQMHATLMYSRAPVDWMRASDAYGQDENGNMRIAPGGARMLDIFGDPTTPAVVLLFNSSELSWRWRSLMNLGCTWEHCNADGDPEYQPHITITWRPSLALLQRLQAGEFITPYRGPILLGPEIFEEVKADGSWRNTFTEDRQ